MFTRKATGLVREIGAGDAFLMNVIFINVVLGLIVLTLAPAIYPGVDLAVGWLLTTVVLIIPILIYAWMAGSMPRSGGEYVYLSRILHPIVGFVFNFVFTVTLLIFAALLSSYVTTTGLSPMFATLGAVTDSQSLTDLAVSISSDGWVFVIAVITVLVCCLANWFGLRVLMRFQRVMFGFAVLALAIAGLLMAFTSRDEFKERFSSFGDYDGVIAAAGQAGFPVGASASFGTLIAFTALGFTVIGLAQMPAWTAGELRRPQRTTLLSMLGAMIGGGLVFALLGGLAQKTFGLDFLGGMTTVSGSDAYPADLPAPFFFLYTGMLTDSTVLIVLMGIGVIAAILGNVALVVTIPTRNMLAWSIDGLLPEWIRRTHPRYHTPVNGIVVIGIASILLLIPLIFGPSDLFNFIFSAAAMQAIVFTVASFGGMLFAFRLPEVFASSPYNRRVGGVPVFSIVGGIATVIYGYFAVTMITDDRVGANSTSGLIAIALGFLLALAVYAVAEVRARSRGVSLSASYRQLPPE
jgi:amino acid transporter